jgi:XTP/dITP diphosphohydrolase
VGSVEQPPRLVLASRNRAKLEELRRTLPGSRLELLDRLDYPPEDGASYEENARAKARFARQFAPADVWVVGEDSGLEVRALRDGPGVRSARFAQGAHVPRLLAALGDASDRRARYVCELVALSPAGEEVRGSGVLAGTIADEPRGSAGFGFDPVFVPEGEDQTVAELGDAWKAENSHRARAARALRGQDLFVGPRSRLVNDDE